MYRFSKPENNKKGILIFKHLEQEVLNDLAFSCYINDLKKSYLIGLYFGFNTKYVARPNIVDFVIAKKDVVTNENSIGVPIYRFSGSSFIEDKILTFRSEDKKFDLIGIFNRSKHKRPELFVQYSKDLQQRIPSLRIKLITYGSVYNNLDFLSHGYSNENFEHIDHIVDGKMWPFTREEIFSQLSQAKYFFLSSSAEGSSRIVVEAALLGLRIFVLPDLRGGTLDKTILDSGAVSIVSNSDEMLSEISANNWKFDQLGIERHYLSKYSLESLVGLIDQDFNGVNLNRVDNHMFVHALPSHLNIISPKYTSDIDDQFLVPRGLVNFLREVYFLKIDGSKILLFVTFVFRFLEGYFKKVVNTLRYK